MRRLSKIIGNEASRCLTEKCCACFEDFRSKKHNFHTIILLFISTCTTMEMSETIAGGKRKCIVSSCGKDLRPEPASHSNHSFPKDDRLRSEWVKALTSTDSSFLDRAIDFNSARICSAHFTADSFQKTGDRKVLQATSVPTLFGASAVKDG